MNTRLDSTEAQSLATKHGFPMGRDFHTLSSSEVERVLTAADERKYRKPAKANGSRARYFYEFLNRAK